MIPRPGKTKKCKNIGHNSSCITADRRLTSRFRKRGHAASDASLELLRLAHKKGDLHVSDRYAGERFSPKVPACKRSTLTLHFDGQFLQAKGSVKAIQFSAVSGRLDAGEFDYSLERQKIPNQGPIPAGDYWIQPSELQENAWYRLKNPRASWGDYWITIHPYPSTETYKRGGFFIHGGDTPGSAGCIDLSVNMNRFVEALANELKGKGICYIPLTVRYPK